MSRDAVVDSTSEIRVRFILSRRESEGERFEKVTRLFLFSDRNILVLLICTHFNVVLFCLSRKKAMTIRGIKNVYRLTIYTKRIIFNLLLVSRV